MTRAMISSRNSNGRKRPKATLDGPQNVSNYRTERDATAEIAKKAHADGTTLKQAAIGSGVLTADAFDKLVHPENMLGEED